MINSEAHNEMLFRSPVLADERTPPEPSVPFPLVPLVPLAPFPLVPLVPLLEPLLEPFELF